MIQANTTDSKIKFKMMCTAHPLVIVANREGNGPCTIIIKRLLSIEIFISNYPPFNAYPG